MANQLTTALLDTFRQVLLLKLLPRTGWLQHGVVPAESVAEHSFGVVALALLVGDSLPEIDRGKLLAMAVLHDLAESALGDLPASASRLLGRAAKHSAERQALTELMAGLPAAPAYMALWEEYSAGTSREARLLKALDRLELLAQALAYEQAGQRGLGQFWQAASEGWDAEFPLLHTLAHELIAQRQAISGERASSAKNAKE